MNELSIINSTLSSLEVAEMVEKTHSKLMRDIRRYSEQLDVSKIGQTDFWEESTYVDTQNREKPCYLVTKKGCEFIAHKLTGAKGTVFTARYINRFHEMEDVIQGNQLAVAEQVTAIHIPEQSPTPLPRALDWFSKNRKRIRRICDIEDMTHSELYHIILSRCGKEYDLNAANEIYNRERGYYPKYAIDIVGYFPQLEEIADKILDRFDVSEKTRKRKRRR